MRRPSESAADHAGVVVPPPLIYLAFFLAGMGLQRYLPVARLPARAGQVLGVALLLPSLLLAVWSFRRFWASRTTILPVRPATALVTEGPYRFTRNPMYLSLLFLYSGVACWFGLLWPLFLAPGLVWVMNVLVIASEERYLARRFGGAFEQYQARVRRWL